MANPQLENGHTKIANELYEALCLAPISIREMKVVMAIIRFSYGFQDKTAVMTHRFIAEKTGLHRQHVSSAINGLVKKNMVVSVGGGYKREYGVQKDYELWKFGTKTVPKQIGTKTVPKENQNSAKFGTNLVPPYLVKENIKKTIKENIYANKSEIGTETVPKSSGNGKPKCPIKKLVDLYHETLPELPKIRFQGKMLKTRISARWSESAERRNLDWWQEYFSQVSGSDFLMGRKTDWRATLDWLCGPKNMEKVLNGRYDNTSSLSKKTSPWEYDEQEQKNAIKIFRNELGEANGTHGEDT